MRNTVDYAESIVQCAATGSNQADKLMVSGPEGGKFKSSYRQSSSAPGNTPLTVELDVHIVTSLLKEVTR